MMELITLSLSSYALTVIVASSSLLEPLREKVKLKIPQLKIGNNKHFIECRLCVGFWVTILVCGGDWGMVLPVYGLAYFLATQER